MLANTASPNSVSASALASMARTLSTPIAASIAFRRRRVARSVSRWRTMSPVGISARLTTARMPARYVAEALGEDDTTISQAISASAAPASMRTWFIASGVAAIRMNESTGPNFWAKPVKSSTELPLPSRWAAIAISAPTVTTPVPPTPVTSRS